MKWHVKEHIFSSKNNGMHTILDVIVVIAQAWLTHKSQATKLALKYTTSLD